MTTRLGVASHSDSAVRTPAQRRRFSMAWMLGSFVFGGGGIALCAVALRIFEVADPWYGHAGYYLGALLGGVTIARASPGVTIVEPTLAAFLLTCVLGGFFGLSPGSRLVWPEAVESGLLHRALSLGLLSLLGGLLGSSVAEHVTRGLAPADRGWRLSCWLCWLSTLSYAGCLLVLWIAILIASRWSVGLPDTDLLLTGSFLLAALAAGAIAQALHQERAALASAAGPLIAMTLVGLGLLAVSPDRPLAVTFLAMGGLLLSTLAWCGGTAYHALRERRRRRSSTDIESGHADAAPSTAH